MKIYISVDMEGVSGVTDSDDVMIGGREYDRNRHYLTADVNAAIAGAFDGGATDVLVNESHGSMRNLYIDELDSRAELIRGNIKPGCMVEGLDESFGAVFFVGYHSMHGVARGIMNHTMLGKELQNLFLNGEPRGEMAFNAAYAGQFGVPIALLTGDQTATAEAQGLFGDLEVVTVKEGIERFTARLLHPTVAQARIREAARRAVERAPSLNPFIVATPARIGVEFTSTQMAEVCSWIPTVERISGRTVEFTFDDWRQGMKLLYALMIIAMQVANSVY